MTRSNHTHVVVSASGFSGKMVRDQLKANCTRGLREHWEEFRERPVWTTGGDCQYINNEDELMKVIEYVKVGQDRRYLRD
ncbi:MAG: hypothetical protein ABGX16_22550 [Pirellulales bacterium]